MDARLVAVAYRPIADRAGNIYDVHRRREYSDGVFKFDTIPPARYGDLCAADAHDHPDPLANAIAPPHRAADRDAARRAAGDGPSER